MKKPHREAVVQSANGVAGHVEKPMTPEQFRAVVSAKGIALAAAAARRPKT